MRPQEHVPVSQHDQGDHASVRPAKTSDPAGSSSPHSLLALQRSIGNRAVVQMLQQAGHPWAQPEHTVQRKIPGPNAPDRHFTDDPAAHPEWPLFHTLMSDAGFSEKVIENLWQLIVGGLLAQEAINPASADPSLTPTERRGQRDNNSWYLQAVEMLRENSGFTTSKMALWSGGLDVCEYAKAKGFTPMEFTRAGKAFNALEYHRDWQLQGPLWNILSKFYVEQATGPVHIFLRTYNPESVLIGREVPRLQQLQQIHPDVELLWHPLYTTPQGHIQEISRDRKLVDDSSFSTRDECVAALYSYLQYHHDESNQNAGRSYDEMNADLANNISH